ncbi:MAG: PAS domain S-box protein [Pelobium sp.]
MKTEDLILSQEHNRTIQAMVHYDAYDISSDKDFKDILDLACFICKCDVSFISFIEDDWQHIRYTKGISPSEIPLEKSLGKFIYEKNDFLEIADVKNDQRAKALLDVSKVDFNYYAGVIIHDTDGGKLGTLCVSDTESKILGKEQIEALKSLATQVLNNLELRKRNLSVIKSEKVKDEFNEMFNSSPDLICILTEDLIIESINHAMFNIMGYQAEECIGTNISKFILSEDRETVFEVANESLTTGLKRFNVETRVKTKSKAIKWIGWNAVTKNRNWFVTGRDITKEKKDLQYLKQLSTVASQINNGVVISDAHNKVVWINNAFSKITGYSIDDLKFQRLADVIVGANSNIEIVEKARIETKNKKSFSVELLAYRKDGKPIWLSIHNTIILDKKGGIESLIEIVIDITDRKQVEERLELLSLVASKTENGVCICDKTGRLNWMNDSLAKIIGYQLTELEGKRLGDVLKGEGTNLKRLTESREKALQSIPYNLELKVYKKDGSPVWLSISNTPILDEKGNTYKQVEIINDISERKLTEAQLLASKEQALQLSKAKEMFLSVMSHEIRTPLNAVIGLTNLLLDGEKLENQEQPLNLLKFSSDNLLDLISNILDFSKIEMGKMELENKRINIRDLIKDIADSLYFKVKEKGIAIKYAIDSKIPELVRGDKTRLYQILINLINNAIKFTEKGYVKINVNLKSVDKDFIRLDFEVEDTGIGVSEDKFGHIFESFTQAEANTTRKYGGTGLGLSIAKRLVELYDGEIGIRSELEKGTTFYFDIKFWNFIEEKMDIKEETIPQIINAKILVVDDNEINRMLASKVLKKYNIEVLTAENGMEAIELLASKDIDLVLMDIHMPGLTGYETAKILRDKEDNYYKELPIIALTASVLNEDLETIFDNGMTDFQLKPFKPDDLIRKITKHLKQK